MYSRCFQVWSAGEDGRARGEHVLGGLGRGAEASRRVFGVGDDHVDPLGSDEGGQARAQNVATGAADDVTDGEHAHTERLGPDYRA